MRRKIVLVALVMLVCNLSFSNNLPTINYILKKTNPLSVSTLFNTTDKKTTEIMWGFVSYDYAEDLTDRLKNLRSSIRLTSANSSLVKKHFFWNEYRVLNYGSVVLQEMKIKHKPLSKVVLSYEMPNINYFRSKKGSQYLPSVMLPGVTKNAADDVNINLNWKELVEDDSTVFTFTTGGKVFVSQKEDHNVSMIMPAKNVISTYFLVAKKNDLMFEKFSIGRTKFSTFAVGMNSKNFSELNKMFKRIIKAQMQDLNELEEHKEYNIIFLEDNKTQVSYYNDFSKTLTMYFNKNTSKMKHLIGHEFLHRVFLRNKLDFAKEVAPHDPDSFWFIEGFNDYLTRNINLNYGVISEEEYVQNLNKVIEAYLSRQRYCSCNKYDAALSTLHGDLLALQIDSKLLHETKGKYNLSKLIRDLVKDKAGTSISTKYIDDLIFRSSGKKVLLSKLLNKSLKGCIKEAGLQLPEYIIGGKYRLQKDFSNKTSLRYGRSIQ